jgi:hypothetical protein
MAKDPLATLQKLRRLDAQAERRALAERLAAETTAGAPPPTAPSSAVMPAF